MTRTTLILSLALLTAPAFAQQGATYSPPSTGGSAKVVTDTADPLVGSWTVTGYAGQGVLSDLTHVKFPEVYPPRGLWAVITDPAGKATVLPLQQETQPQWQGTFWPRLVGMHTMKMVAVDAAGVYGLGSGATFNVTALP